MSDPWIPHQDQRLAAWAEQAALGVKDHFVYTYFGEAGEVLYVGVTTKPDQRDRSHRSQSSKWYAKVARRDVAGPFTQPLAMYYEYRAICGLVEPTPPHNARTSNGFTGPGSWEWSAQDSDARNELISADPEFRRQWREWKISELGPEWGLVFDMFGPVDRNDSSASAPGSEPSALSRRADGADTTCAPTQRPRPTPHLIHP